jgi:SNF2 family DNA or RNA helicase
MDYLIKPWQHQLEAILKSCEMKRDEWQQLVHAYPDIALFFEMGTGKTSTTINILRCRYAEQKRLMRTLIIGPVIVVDNWRREFGMHSRIKDHDILCLTGDGKKRVKQLTESLWDHSTNTLTRPKIVITNYEGIYGKDGSALDEIHKILMRWGVEILVCDESQRLKNPASKRAMRVATIADKTKHNYILTGTPILNSALDIFHQYRVLDRGQTFGDNFYVFRSKYFEDSNAGMPSKVHFPKWEPRIETYQRLNHDIYKKALRVLKKDCLDLPPLVKTRYYVELGGVQRRMYNEMKEEYLTFVYDLQKKGEQPPAVVAQMALVKALRLLQIVSGFSRDENKKDTRAVENPRLEAVSELLEDITPGQKVILWATFQENYRMLADVCAALKVKHTELHGGISQADKVKNMDRFRKDEDCRVIICNQQAAGIGVNLVEAGTSLFYSRNFSLEQDLQAESRNYRGGSEMHQKVTRIDLVARDTIDELVLEALAGKLNIAEQVLAWGNKL